MAVCSILLIIGAAGVAVPLALRVAASKYDIIKETQLNAPFPFLFVSTVALWGWISSSGFGGFGNKVVPFFSDSMVINRILGPLWEIYLFFLYFDDNLSNAVR